MEGGGGVLAAYVQVPHADLVRLDASTIQSAAPLAQLQRAVDACGSSGVVPTGTLLVVIVRKAPPLAELEALLGPAASRRSTNILNVWDSTGPAAEALRRVTQGLPFATDLPFEQIQLRHTAVLVGNVQHVTTLVAYPSPWQVGRTRLWSLAPTMLMWLAVEDLPAYEAIEAGVHEYIVAWRRVVEDHSTAPTAAALDPGTGLTPAVTFLDSERLEQLMVDPGVSAVELLYGSAASRRAVSQHACFLDEVRMRTRGSVDLKVLTLESAAARLAGEADSILSLAARHFALGLRDTGESLAALEARSSSVFEMLSSAALTRLLDQSSSARLVAGLVALLATVATVAGVIAAFLAVPDANTALPPRSVVLSSVAVMTGLPPLVLLGMRAARSLRPATTVATGHAEARNALAAVIGDALPGPVRTRHHLRDEVLLLVAGTLFGVAVVLRGWAPVALIGAASCLAAVGAVGRMR